MKEVGSSGPQPARLLIVGEAPGEEEEQQGLPFIGTCGYELNRQLGEVGLTRADARITNVCRERPPGNDIQNFFAKSKRAITQDHRLHLGRYCLPPIIRGIDYLAAELEATKPDLIIGFGGTALWALTGQEGISKWRGSDLQTPSGIPVLPTLHPSAVLRGWSNRPAVIRDLRRASQLLYGSRVRTPLWRFRTRPSYGESIFTLECLLSRVHAGEELVVSLDIETSRGHIACIGIAWTLLDSICIPLTTSSPGGSYWLPSEEAAIQKRIHALLTHRNIRVIGQNILYDVQWFWKHLHYIPRVWFDTMIGQHAIFSDLPKDLGFLASMYCDYYRYWKDEGKGMGGGSEDQWWHYNCLDTVYTLEVYHALMDLSSRMQRTTVQDTQQRLFYPVLRAMQRGIRVDIAKRFELKQQLEAEIESRQLFIDRVAGTHLNPRSHVQLKRFFYEDLKLAPQVTRSKKGSIPKLTTNDEALAFLGRSEPLVKPITTAIADIRTLGIFLNTFVQAPLDEDGRMRCSYRIGGSESGESAPKTYRLASAENAFGHGCNLQTVPSAKSKSVNKLKSRGSRLRLPNLRTMFIPDPGFTFFNGDLDRADLQVVAWEINDEQLKKALREGVDIHLLNAFILDDVEPPTLAELVEGHPAYTDHRLPRSATREFAKTFCHATNYGGGARTVAAATGRRVAEIERAQALWFLAHPGLRDWHRRVEEQVRSKRYVENAFGYRWYIFDRVEGILPEAIAWIPQSTVSNLINRIWQRWEDEIPEVEVLLQVHDSLGGQYPSRDHSHILPKLVLTSQIPIPYPDPLIIPFSIKTSERSWGDCE